MNYLKKIEYNLNMQYEYYLNFTTTGIHTVKIIFKKNYYDVIIYFHGVIIYTKLIVQILIVLKSLIAQVCLNIVLR